MCILKEGKLNIDDSIYYQVIEKYECLAIRKKKWPGMFDKLFSAKGIGVGSIVERSSHEHLFNEYSRVIGKDLKGQQFVVTAISNGMITLGEVGKEFNVKFFREVGKVPNEFQ